ncbi:MAG: CHRD domain-containing protein, partial [Bryobacteraceae bacterium]
MKRKLSLFAGLIALCAFGVRAQADSVFTATLNGDSEAPSSMGSGFAWVDYNPTANDITYSLSFQNLGSDAIMSHIHAGAPGTNGPIVLWFFPATLMPTPSATSGSYSGTWTAADLSTQTQDPAIT